MNGNLAQFGEDLRLHLLRLQASLNNINRLFSESKAAHHVEFSGRLDELRVTAKDSAERTKTLREVLASGLDREMALSPETVARWVSKRQTSQLHARADLIEQLAATAVELATLSTLEAERIAMTAILARRQAVTVQIQGDGGR